MASNLREAYAEQIQALSDGGVDALLIETIFDVENARIAIEEARRIAPQLPIMLSFSVSTPDGHNMLGQDICEFLTSFTSDIKHQTPDLFSVGINCVSDIAQMTPLICRLALFGTKVSLYPNAGMPDSNGHYSKTPHQLLADVWPLLEGHCLNIIGGCCGTTDNHISLMAKAIEPVKGIWLSPLDLGSSSSRPSRPSRPSDTSDSSETSEPVSPAERLFEAILHGKSDEAAVATKDG